jgi:NAD(P)-dependent dehydrogenase (short-subunit alcohol dehydrogenase family)
VSFDFGKKVALATGAGSGIGLATARAFADAGAAVVLADHDEMLLRSAVEATLAGHHRALGVRCDVTNEHDVAAMVERAVVTFGRLDAALNNAGIQVPVAETADATAEDFDRATAVNLRGVWTCMKHELRHMRTQRSGAIVNMSSQGGIIANPGLGAHVASKHGVIGLTKSAALEYARQGIRVNSICPGAIRTPMVERALTDEPETMNAVINEIPLGRLGTA